MPCLETPSPWQNWLKTILTNICRLMFVWFDFISHCTPFISLSSLGQSLRYIQANLKFWFHSSNEIQTCDRGSPIRMGVFTLLPYIVKENRQQKMAWSNSFSLGLPWMNVNSHMKLRNLPPPFPPHFTIAFEILSILDIGITIDKSLFLPRKV